MDYRLHSSHCSECKYVIWIKIQTAINIDSIISDEYTNQTGEKLAPTKSGGEEYMKSLYPDVIEDMFGRYRSNSEKSAHIVKMVAEQNTKFSPNYRGNTRIFNNALNRTFHNVRPTVSYVYYNSASIFVIWNMSKSRFWLSLPIVLSYINYKWFNFE